MSLADPTTEAVLAGIRRALAARPAALEAIVQVFGEAMTKGLAGAGSSLKMLPTFALQPRGDEQGKVVVLDWGGTHGRAAMIELQGRGEMRRLEEVPCPFNVTDKTETAAHVFDALAATVKKLVGPAGNEILPLAFVYSFPARLEKIDRAFALAQTKGWNVQGLAGQDVVALLGLALKRQGVGHVAVKAVANDTVAPLVLQSYRQRGALGLTEAADLGLILGTGTNLAADLPGVGIRNLESGNFDGVTGVETTWDRALDRGVSDPQPGAQRFEKMVSGQYLGEILRRIVVDIGRSTSVCQWSDTAIGRPFALDSAILSGVVADTSGDLARTSELLQALGVASTPEERSIVGELARLLARRSARLVGASLVGAVRFMDPAIDRRHTIAVDGSLWIGYPGFAQMVGEAFAELLGSRADRVQAVFVKDSTSAGAAVLAAVAARSRG